MFINESISGINGEGSELVFMKQNDKIIELIK